MKYPSRLWSHLLTSLNFLLFSAIPLVTSRKNDSLQLPQIIFSLFLYFSLAAANTCSCSRKTVWVGDIPQAECFNCSCVLSSSTPKTLKMVLLAHSHGLPHSPSDLPLFAASSTTWCSYSHKIFFTAWQSWQFSSSNWEIWHSTSSGQSGIPLTSALSQTLASLIFVLSACKATESFPTHPICVAFSRDCCIEDSTLLLLIIPLPVYAMFVSLTLALPVMQVLVLCLSTLVAIMHKSPDLDS